MYRFIYILKQFFVIVLCLNIIFSLLIPASAQKRVVTPKTNQLVSNQPTPKGNGGWSGVVTYKRTLKDSLESDEPGIRKSIDRIKHKTSRDYDYTGRAVIDGTDPKNPIVNTNVTFSDNDLNWGEERVFDTCNATETGHWFIIEGTDDRQTQARAEGAAESFNLSVDEMGGMYNFSMSFPEAQGTYKREQHVKRSGHCQPKNNEPTNISESEATKIEGASFSIDSQKIDPKNPDVLTGTKIWGDDGSGAVRTFIFEVSWHFTRGPQKLLITDLKFEHPKFPDYENWKEIDETKGTIDGNRVKVKAKVLNLSAETKYADLKVAETYKGDKYNYARPDEPLPEGEMSLRLEAGEEREVEFVWDTEGQSWFDDGRPHLFHRIKAELTENGQKKDEKVKSLNIAPKPLVLVHGIWSDYKVWQPLYQNLLTENHSYQWKAYLVGEKATHGAMSTGGKFLSNWYSDSVYDNADQLARYVKYAQEDANAWHVDMVAHTTGGLVARLYMHKLMPNVPDARPQVKHLIMLGTPNGGAPCIDVFLGKFDMFKKELKAAKELTNEEMINFNKYVVNTGGTKFSALAGNSVPVICGGLEWNDGFTTVKSAHYGVSDVGQSNDLSYQLTDGKNFGSFVKPHLVTGPKKTYPYPVKNDPTDWKRWQINNRDYDVNMGSGFNHIYELQPNNPAENSYALFDNTAKLRGPNAGNAENYQAVSDKSTEPFSKELKIAPKQTIEVEIPVAQSTSFGLTFMAGEQVSATLIDEKGAIVGKNLAGTEIAKMIFRPIFTIRPVTGGTWKLKLENTSEAENVVMISTWAKISGTLFYVTAGKPTAAKRIPLQAVLKNDGSAVTNSVIKAKLAGQTGEIAFFDDGQHDDGAANDGIYGALTGILTNGEYFVEAVAETNGPARSASTSFTVGVANAKTTTQKTKK
ncbi:MAG: choice-of-anchor X domain-containing protein [Pyrinomonadaceae bacterium]